MIKHCYIQIPFCKKICSYCDFCKMFYKDEMVEEYLSLLEKEIKNTYQGESLKTIYIGGGTPSCLTTNQLKRLFTILSYFKKDKNIEFTIEGNIETTTKEKLMIYKQYGINRLSFGIESTHPKNLEFLEREFSKEQTKKVLNDARKLGFHNINLDIIYALPTEDLKMLEEDLDYIISLNPEHISTYSLMIEPHTKLEIKKEKNISEDLDASMYDMIKEKLSKASYQHYEISNFSKKGYESKHNLCYWQNKEYYGFGLGASSYIHNKRIMNTRSWTDYKRGFIQKEIEYLTKKDEIEYEILLNLRTKEGINLKYFKQKYQKELQELYHYQDLLEEKYLLEKENHLFIPEDKWYISNEIIVQLLGCEKYE